MPFMLSFSELDWSFMLNYQGSILGAVNNGIFPRIQGNAVNICINGKGQISFFSQYVLDVIVLVNEPWKQITFTNYSRTRL